MPHGVDESSSPPGSEFKVPIVPDCTAAQDPANERRKTSGSVRPKVWLLPV
jgi:hypothetical protein